MAGQSIVHRGYQAKKLVLVSIPRRYCRDVSSMVGRLDFCCPMYKTVGRMPRTEISGAHIERGFSLVFHMANRAGSEWLFFQRVFPLGELAGVDGQDFLGWDNGRRCGYVSFDRGDLRGCVA